MNENKSQENRENDGFSSSDGEFDEQVESWRVSRPEIKLKKLEEELQEQREKNEKLTDELKKTKECFAKYKEVGEEIKSRLQGKVQELNNTKAELKLKNENLKEKQLENEKLRNNLNYYRNRTLELAGAKATSVFNDKHVVPRHLSPSPSPPKKKIKFTRRKRWFGSFRCNCGRSWSSGYTWTLDDKPQPMQCQNCMTSVLPDQLVSSIFIYLM